MLHKFRNRKEAGEHLAKALSSYKGKDIVVLGLPRGGVIVAKEIAIALQVPLDLVFAHKIGHPLEEEYAIAAISESGHLVGNQNELKGITKEWLEEKKKEALEKIRQRRELYLRGRAPLSLKNKIAILVDDGIATGLTVKAAILEVNQLHPKKLVLAVPILPRKTAEELKTQIDELVALRIDPDEEFLGSVGAYFRDFPQVEDEEVTHPL